MRIGKLRISVIRNKSFEDSRYAIANIGESIQSVVLSHIYAKCGVKEEDIIRINQCDIRSYRGEPIILPLRLPLSKENVDDYLPLDESVHPYFISLHLHDDIFEDRDDLVEYFRRHEPIGCRDEISCSFFLKHNIESYVMGCYTLCFPERYRTGMEDKVVCVDVSKELYTHIPDELKRGAVHKSHATPYNVYPVTPEEDKRLETVAGEYLDFYRNTAELVITSRLHVAAPCIAMGIPVVLGTNNADFRYAWIDRFIPVYQLPDYDNISWNVGSVDVEMVRNELMNVFDGIINKDAMPIDSLKRLNQYYRNRNKSDYYKLFRMRLERLRETYANNSFNYAIWGAGNHSLFAHELMSEMYPNAHLEVVVDKFKRGLRFGVPVVSGEKLVDYAVNHVVITTKPGLQEALEICNRIFGNTDGCYTIITSQQES